MALLIWRPSLVLGHLLNAFKEHNTFSCSFSLKLIKLIKGLTDPNKSKLPHFSCSCREFMKLPIDLIRFCLLVSESDSSICSIRESV